MITDIDDCPNCDRLREAYSRVTRKELELAIQLDEAARKNDSSQIEELQALLAAVGVVRAGASQTVLDHAMKHGSREALPSSAA